MYRLSHYHFTLQGNRSSVSRYCIIFAMRCAWGNLATQYYGFKSESCPVHILGYIFVLNLLYMYFV